MTCENCGCKRKPPEGKVAPPGWTYVAGKGWLCRDCWTPKGGQG